MECRNGDDDPVVVFVSKVIASPASESDSFDRGAKIFVPKQRDLNSSVRPFPFLLRAFLLFINQFPSLSKGLRASRGRRARY